MIDFKKYTHAALFAGGLLFGTAGLKLLSSKDAKNVYAHTTAAALRVKDCVMKGVDKVQERGTRRQGGRHHRGRR